MTKVTITFYPAKSNSDQAPVTKSFFDISPYFITQGSKVGSFCHENKGGSADKYICDSTKLDNVEIDLTQVGSYDIKPDSYRAVLLVQTTLTSCTAYDKRYDNPDKDLFGAGAYVLWGGFTPMRDGVIDQARFLIHFNRISESTKTGMLVVTKDDQAFCGKISEETEAPKETEGPKPTGGALSMPVIVGIAALLLILLVFALRRKKKSKKKSEKEKKKISKS